jgi:hypothetical protein
MFALYYQLMKSMTMRWSHLVKHVENVIHMYGLSVKKRSNRGSLVGGNINPLKTTRRLLYLKTQSVPRSKHFSSVIKTNQFML